MNRHSAWLREEASLNEKAGSKFAGTPNGDYLLSIAAKERDMFAAFDVLLAACKKSLDHIQELKDAWSRGAIHEIDCKVDTRSSHNVDIRVILQAAIRLAKGGSDD